MSFVTKEELLQLIETKNKDIASQIYNTAINNPFELQLFTIDLSVARTLANPFEIPFAFKSIAFKDGTTVNSNCSVQFNSKDSGLSSLNFKSNDNLSSDFMFDSAYITNTAQPGQSIVCYVFVKSTFRSGSYINSGTVQIAPAAAFNITNPVLAAASATSIIAQNTSRQKFTVQNKTGASVWLGGSTVTNTGATTGLELINGNSVEILSTAQWYAYSVAGAAAGLLTVVQES